MEGSQQSEARSCKQCGVDISGKQWSAKFCGNTCGMRNHRAKHKEFRSPRSCKHCGADISGRRANASYCSTYCQIKVQKYSSANRNKGAEMALSNLMLPLNLPERNCAWCMGNFRPYRKQQIYCSKQCQGRASRHRAKGGTMIPNLPLPTPEIPTDQNLNQRKSTINKNISQIDPTELTTEDIAAEINGFVELAEEVVARLSVLLTELRRRGQPHPFFSHPIMRFWQSLADQSLHPEAAILLANRTLISAVLPLPLPRAEQIEIAHGKEVPVAVMRDDGTIETEKLPIRRMEPRAVNRVFSDEGIRSVEAQVKILKDKSKIVRMGMITVLKDDQMLKIGNAKIKPEELVAPLRALGYTLTLTRTAGDQQDAKSLEDVE